MSFLKAEALQRLKNKRGILAVNELINWEEIITILGRVGRSGFGPRGYSPIQLLKALILQNWHNLSDPALEEALRVRLDFMPFTGLEEDIPDETTLCRFRNRLVNLGVLKTILGNINRQLERSSIKVSTSDGAIVDATFISSSARPRKEIDASVDQKKPTVRFSADPDARWAKKGKHCFFGYKGFMITDAKKGFIEKVHVTSANQSEVTALEDVLGNLKAYRLYADKGYASQKNRQLLRENNIKDGISHKATRGKPLSQWQRAFNRKISSIRFLVEQGFGTLKRRFCFSRSSYITLAKVEAQMIMKAIAFNLLKASRCISIC